MPTTTSMLFADFHHHLTMVRDSDRPTEKLDHFMDAYKTYVAIHEQLCVSAPTVDGSQLTSQKLRETVTADELRAEWDPDVFTEQISLMEQKVYELERVHDHQNLVTSGGT